MGEYVEVESHDVGEEEDEADIDGEGAHRPVEMDQAVLHDVASHWADGHF